MARLLFLLCMLLSAPLFADPITLEVIILFEKDGSELTREAMEELEELLQKIHEKGDRQLIVHGHTDSDGSIGYNEALSLARARTVTQFLIASGIDEDLILLDHFGELSPTAPNTDDHSMALNRRVTVTYIHHQLETIEDMKEAMLERKMQHFIIDPDKEEVIHGAAGTAIRFSPNTLVDAKGRRVAGPVEVQLTEALDLQSMVANDLSTRSGDVLLETGGMLKLEAFSSSGDTLSLRTGATVEIAVPTMLPQEDMELFLSSDGSDWSAAGQTLVVTRTEDVFRSGPIFQPPLRPSTALPFKMPVYRESKKGMPMRPAFPTYPIPPTEPRAESYTVNVAWWEFWAKKSRQQQAEARFAKAKEAYSKKMERFKKRVEYYENDMATYDDRMAQYEVRMKEWEEKKQVEYDTWYRTVKQDALLAYAELQEAYRPTADSLLANWEAAYGEAYSVWNEQRRQYMDSVAVEMDRSNTATFASTQAYLFTTGQFGWINCDRFMNYPPELMHEVIVEHVQEQDAQVLLVFEDINSVLTMYPDQDGKFHSGQVPRRQKITLFAYTVIDGRAHLCVQPVTGSTIEKLEFKPSSMVEVTRRLNEIRDGRA